jgi:hypothetical protein
MSTLKRHVVGDRTWGTAGCGWCAVIEGSPVPCVARVSVRILVALALTGCASLASRRVPELDGDGRLRRLEVPGDRGLCGSIATPDERFLVFDTTGLEPLIYSTDHRLALIRKGRIRDVFGRSRKANTVLAASGLRFELLSVPGLDVEDRLDVPRAEKVKFGGGIGQIGLCPYKDDWIHVNGTRGHIVELKTSPLRVGRSGRAVTKHLLAAAADQKTGMLVLAGDDRSDDRFIEVYDLAQMKPGTRTQVDCKELGYHIRAGNGTAWIATREGRFLHFDIASATVTGDTVLNEKTQRNNVALDLSASGDYLAACSTILSEGDCPTVLKVFRVGKDAELAEVASARAKLPYSFHSITILEKERLVILSSQKPFVWSYGAKKEKEDTKKQ